MKREKVVWILNHYAQEPGGPGGTRHFSLAHHLEQFGWKACIIAASTELNTNRQRLAPDEPCRLDQIQGVPFLWLKTPAYEGNGPGRMANMLAYAFQALRRKNLASLPRPDVVIGSSVHPFAGFAGERLAVRYRVPFIFEVRDLWPQTLIEFGRIPPDGATARLMRALEKRLYRRSAAIITLLPQAWRYIGTFGIPRERVFNLPNGVDLSDFPDTSPPQDHDQFVFMYFGAHGNANALDNLVSAMALLPPGNIRLRMVGEGPLKPELMRQAAGLANIAFESPVPKQQIPTLAAQADAFVACLPDLPLYRYGISLNKLYDFLAAGRPIVFAGDAANNPVAEAGAGPTVPPGKPELLAAAMVDVANLPRAQRIALGGNARRYVEQTHDYPILAQRLAGLLDGVTER